MNYMTEVQFQRPGKFTFNGSVVHLVSLKKITLIIVGKLASVFCMEVETKMLLCCWAITFVFSLEHFVLNSCFIFF